VVNDLASRKLHLYSVIHLNERISVANGAAIMGGNVGDLLLSDLLLVDAAKLVANLLIIDAVESKAALGIVEQAELITRLFNGHDIWNDW